MQQTAVEWLWEQIDNRMPFQNIQSSQVFNGLLNQAKEMEKDQHIETATHFFPTSLKKEHFEKYYHETYGE